MNLGSAIHRSDNYIKLQDKMGRGKQKELHKKTVMDMVND
jgi:hypothetical protein